MAVVPIGMNADRTGDNLAFVPEDIGKNNILELNELTELLIPIIEEVRKSINNSEELSQSLKNLEKYKDLAINKPSSKDIYSYLEAYEGIKRVSLSLRKLLKTVISDLEIYDNISYAVYYKDKRYSFDKVDPSWVRVTSSGTLQLKMNQVAKDLTPTEEELENNIKLQSEQLIDDAISNHYIMYKNAISGMYSETTGYILGKRQQKGQSLNLGHVAEAFESHLGEHDDVIFQNYIQGDRDESTVIETLKRINNGLVNLKGYWSPQHESADEAWVHIRSALGNQAGTVAGDVGRFQVKQGQGSGGARIRLASYPTLQNGINTYLNIMNNTLSSKEVAEAIARYMSEDIGQKGSEIIANELNTMVEHLVHI